MKVFEFDSYKDYLQTSIENSGRRGLISEWARAAGCSHSYLSQVLHGKPDLTPDQAWALSEHLVLTKEEADYFFLLVLNARAITSKLKKNFEFKLKNLRLDQLRTSKAVQKSTITQIDSAIRDRYYSNWSTSAIHALTASPCYQTIEEISKRLSLAPTEVENILRWLVENSFVKRSGQNYIHSGQSIHLPTESVHNQLNHLNWRLRGIQSSSKTENVHYSSAFTISKKDWDRLRSDLISFIENQRTKIQSSGSEEGYSFCCDLFQI